jgi:hypothetical protein
MAHVGPRKYVHVPAPSPLGWIRQILLRAFGRPLPPPEPPIEKLVNVLDEREGQPPH